MNKYIVVTTCGQTQDNHGNAVDNCQVLGFYDAESVDQLSELVNEDWKERIKDKGFCNIFVYMLQDDSPALTLKLRGNLCLT